MDKSRSNPNKPSSLRSGAALLAVGALGLIGCANESADKSTATAQSETRPSTSSPLEVDNNCSVSNARVSFVSKSERTVGEFVDNHLGRLSHESGVDLKVCADEVISAALSDRSNIEQGLGGPNATTHTISLPAQVTRK